MKNIFAVIITLLISSGLLLPADLTINQPNGNSPLYKGFEYTISWTPGNTCTSTVYKINIFKDSIQQSNFKLQLTTTDQTLKKWTIPKSFESGTYFIRVKTDNNSCYGDSKPLEIKAKYVLNPDIFKKNKPVFKPKPGMFQPVIEGVLDIPLGALKPGSKLYLKGKKFGTQKGKILVKGNFPGGQFELTNVKWESNDKANGVVPMSVNGNPNQTVGVVLVTANNFASKPWNMKFEGRISKWLVLGDAKIIHCGQDDNFPVCNKLSPDGSICAADTVICGYHRNKWGAIGDDKGADTYRITLNNGWVFKQMVKVKWYKSSGDEKLNGPSPALPIGQSFWQPTITWLVTPNDKVLYQLKVEVEGPIGTNYK